MKATFAFSTFLVLGSSLAFPPPFSRPSEPGFSHPSFGASHGPSTASAAAASSSSAAVPSASSLSIPPAPVASEAPRVPGAGESNSTSANLDLIHLLETAPTAVDRVALLNNGSDFVFDFRNPASAGLSVVQGNGGHTVKADRNIFPALIGTGVGMTVGFIGPCGFNTPHVHPRSAEMNIVVQGELCSQFITENGGATIHNCLSDFQMTVFPQGAIHTEFNPTCEPAMFVAGFGSEDAGVLQVAQGMFSLDDDVLQAAFANNFQFAGENIDQFKELIPKNVALGVESCLQKCGIAKK